MLGRLRTVLALTAVATAGLVMAPVVWAGLRTGTSESRGIIRTWHRIVVRALGFRLHVHGSQARDRPLLIVANHVSWTDIVLIGSVTDVSFVARADMGSWPVVGWLARLQRTVFIEREQKRKSGQQADEIAARLARGDAIVLFAEGTTGDGNGVMPFKSTLFGSASMMLARGEAETVFVQPLAIAYTRLHGVPMGRLHRPLAAWIGDQDMASHVRALLRRPAIDVELHFGEPVAFHPGTNRKDVARLVEADVRASLAAAIGRPKG